MKNKFIVLTVILFTTIFACKKESNLATKPSAADIEAAEGMENAYKTANLYNDSLKWCNENDSTCNPEFLAYCDSIFHENDESYEMHHNNYSHNNISDDHHHSAKAMHQHGSEEAARHNEKGSSGSHGHSLVSQNEMDDLRANHGSYHPL